MITNDDPLLTPREAADYLSRDSRTMANERCSGRGPRFARIGRVVRYRQSDLDAYIKSCIVEVTREQ